MWSDGRVKTLSRRSCMSKKSIVLVANILIRSVLGKRARELIVDNAEMVQCFAPDVVYADAQKYPPALLKKEA